MTRAQQTVFVVVFLALIGAVPLIESARDLTRERHPQFLDVFLRIPTRTNLRQFEKSLEEDSAVARATRPWIQYTQYALFGDLGEKVLPGRDLARFFQVENKLDTIVRYDVAQSIPLVRSAEDPGQAVK